MGEISLSTKEIAGHHKQKILIFQKVSFQDGKTLRFENHHF